jgi:outer membrane protein OmpA-like peptidoglycan-associated protein
MKNLWYTVLFLFFIHFCTYSQKDKSLKAADKKFEDFAFVDARKVYLDVANSGYKSENLFKKLGDSYYFNNELSQSLQWYQQLYNFQKKIDSEYLFRYAMALKSVKKYTEAQKILGEYNRAINPNYNESSTIIKKNSSELIALNKTKFTVEKTSINSEYSEYSPAYYNGKLVFSSNRKDKNNISQKISTWNNEPFSDFYLAAITKNNDLDFRVERFDSEINSEYHESSAVFSPDGNTMYFTRNNYINKKYKVNSKGINLLKIFKAGKNKDGKWQTPLELSFNSNEYSCAHPAISLDGKYLYFSSDMPGTVGMSDIFVVAINTDGSYGAPENLGTTINTVGRESYPYISKKNQLFFSSDGHDGLGGFDLFVTSFKDYASVTEIMNLGSPINSPTDDFSLIVDSDDNTGFFASNREGGSGSDDIYGLKISGELISNCKQYLSGFVIDQTTGNGIMGINVTLFQDNMLVSQTTITNQTGEYKFDVACNTQYSIRADGDGFQTLEKSIQISSDYEKNISYDIIMQQGRLLGIEKIMSGDDLAKTLELDPIYFNFDQSDIRPDAEVELQKVIAFLKDNKNFKIDIRSHTDGNGGRNYNLKLSQERAISTINYFERNGIDKFRLSGKGYGDTQLVNECYQGVNCSEEMHQLNRRSEFIVIESNILNNNNEQSALNKNNSDVLEKQDRKMRQPNLNNSVATSSTKIINSKIAFYDFESSLEVYTVQLSALTKPNSEAFKEFKITLFTNLYADGFTRYFSGTFNAEKAAQDYKRELLKKGLKNLFVVKLKGNDIRSK